MKQKDHNHCRKMMKIHPERRKFSKQFTDKQTIERHGMILTTNDDESIG
jgi:hypothetical protein